jgi:hypothetical protein
MAASRRGTRGAVVVCLALGLVAGACEISTSSPSPSHPAASLDGAGIGTTLTAGLAANLDKLDSYQFIETIPVDSTSAAASAGRAARVIRGTVINRPVRSLWIYIQPGTNIAPGQFIVIGDQAWRSSDGITWTVSDPNDPFLTDLLPGHDYALWFDAKAAYFRVVAEESMHGVPCVRYEGDPSLSSLYAGYAGTSVRFQADLWIARDGAYPVSGVYGFSAMASLGGSWGFNFDVTSANDSSNKVASPTDVVAIPT